MSFLPPLGTVYPSLDHFKLDVYTRAVSANQFFYEPETSQDSSTQDCRILCTDSEHQVYGRQRCRAGTSCTRSYQGVYVVYATEPIHTCLLSRERNLCEEVNMKRRKSEAAIKVEAFEFRRRLEGPGVSLMRFGERSGLDQEKETKDLLREKRVKTTSSGACGSSESTFEMARTKFEVSEGFFPRAFSLQKRIDELKSILLHLPSADESFSTPEELLARLYAFSQQQGVLLERCLVTATSTMKELLCSHNYKEYEQVAGGRCPVVYRIEKGRNGNWFLCHPLKFHSHPICSTPPAPVPTPITPTLHSPSRSFHQQDLSRSLLPSDSSTSFSLSRLPPNLAHSLPSRTLPDYKLEPSVQGPIQPISRSSASPPYKLSSSNSRPQSPPAPNISSPTSIPAKRSRESSTPPQVSRKSPCLSNQKQEEDERLEVSTSTKVIEVGMEEETNPYSPIEEEAQSEDASKQETNPFSVPLPFPSPASLSATLSSSTSSSVHNEPEELEQSISLDSIVFSFLPLDKVPSTLSTFRSHGIDSLDTLVNILSIEELVCFDRLVGTFETETGELMKEMRKDLQEFLRNEWGILD